MSGAIKASGGRNATRFFALVEEVEARLACGGDFVEHGGAMRLCSHFHIRLLPCVAFLFAAGLRAPGDEPAPARVQARQANAASALNVPATAVPATVAPRIDDAGSLPSFSPGEIGGLTIPAPAPAVTPDSAMPQNRVLPANVGNAGGARNANARGAAPDPARARQAYSPNWLVDGVRQLEAESRQRFNPDARTARQTGVAGAGEKTTYNDSGNGYNDDNGNNGNRNEDDHTRASANTPASASASAFAFASASASAPASAPATTDNPLAAYLDKWITTPEGAAAARAGVANAPAQADAAPALPAAILLERSNLETNVPWHPDTAPARTTSWLAAGNPYIDDMFQPQMETKGLDVLLPPPPIPPPDATPAPPPLAPAPANSPAETAPVGAAKLIIKPLAPPPTAPVVDEKKYFPQLQRF